MPREPNGGDAATTAEGNQAAAPRVALYDHSVFREHDAGAGHPERPQRLDALRKGIREGGLEERLLLKSPPSATREQLLRVHSESHLNLVASTQGRRFRFDPDTQAGPRSYEAALRAAGSVVEAVERVLAGELERAFCAVRPPGHHAESDRAVGFCLFNNVAVGAAHALARGLTRVLVVDFDVHHGNGTQAIFYEDPRVLYVSSHLFPFYPGTGAFEEQGEGRGRGFTVNLPLPPGMGDAEYTGLYREIVEPVGRAFRPELVLVSVGFDSHRDDPLASMAVTERGFAQLADVCITIASEAAQGRAVFVLEGGYDLEGIARSSAAVVSVLLGDTPDEMLPEPAPEFDALLRALRAGLGSSWPVLHATSTRTSP